MAAPTGGHRPVSHRATALLASVPVLLISLYALPRTVRVDFALAYGDPSLVSAYTGHFVHLSLFHLLGNLLVYVLVVPTAFALASHSGRRRLFWAAFVTVLCAFPVTLSVLNLVFERSALGVGFSGLNMAFVGLLAVLLVDYLAVHYPGYVDRTQATWLFIATVGLIGALTIPSPVHEIVGTLVVCGVGLLAPSTNAVVLGPVRNRFLATDGSEVALLAGLLLCWVLVVAFPADVATDGTIINVYTHLLGYCLGFQVSYAASFLLDCSHVTRTQV
jgi:hypothetical protein